MSKKYAIAFGAIAVVIAIIALIHCIRNTQNITTKSILKANQIDFTIDDSTGGNSDSRINPGETIKLYIQMKNTGKVALSASNLLLFTSHPGINITDSLATFPGIDPGDSASASAPYIFSVDHHVPEGCLEFGLSNDDHYRATISTQIFFYTYACIADYQFQEGRDNAPDMFKIRLHICNDTNGPLSSVAVHIPQMEVANCGDNYPTLLEPFSASAAIDKVYYGDISNNECKPPQDGSPAVEFIFSTIHLKSKHGPHCIHFRGDIYEGASVVTTVGISQIVIDTHNTAILRKSFELGVKIVLP